MAHHAELLQSLRAAGYRLTPQRESVLAAIAGSGSHLTAEQIMARVRERYPYMNKSAIYRSLDLLVELGLVTQTDLGRGRVEYELHRHPHHHHLICRRCRRIEQVDHAAFAALAKKLETVYGFQADLDHFAVFGRCKRCQARNPLRKP